eukprot:CAMPEP_0170508134 /NCGR_PEP_ID=MMETSP0208-20121228/61367_1 /TAXON_ID=197538 /ORGANISM="Strombidium inclinatum, Strain S3" /LENGTH=81 /DNA_ID=CAMNT_0010790853 /DNA_START=778 /DNA_END=1019 /DNA_ORIENTATION=-
MLKNNFQVFSQKFFQNFSFIKKECSDEVKFSHSKTGKNNDSLLNLLNTYFEFVFFEVASISIGNPVSLASEQQESESKQFG